MIGTLNSKSNEATIIGGGISGLLAAYYLVKSGYRVEVFEAQDRWGGLIQTRTTPQGIAEAAAHSLLVTAEVEALFADLGVELLEVRPESKARWILRNQKLSKFPLSFIEILIALIKAVFQRAKSKKMVSLSEWTLRHLGKAPLNYLINPMLRGIFGASPSDILVHSAFPSLVIPPGQTLILHLVVRAIKKRFGHQSNSARPKMMSPKNGMEEVTSRLVDYLKNHGSAQLHLNHKLAELPQTPNLILAVPPFEAARLLRKIAPPLSVALEKVRYASLVTTTVFIKKSSFDKIPQGVGVLFPEVEKRACLGILFNSSSFTDRVNNPDQWVSLTAISEYRSNPSSNHELESTYLSQIETDLKAIFGLNEPIQHFKMTRWEKAIPLYDQNLDQVWQVARSSWASQPGQILAGNFTGEVSIRGMIESTAKIFKDPKLGQIDSTSGI